MMAGNMAVTLPTGELTTIQSIPPDLITFPPLAED